MLSMQVNSINSAGLSVQGIESRPADRSATADGESSSVSETSQADYFARAMDEVPDLRAETIERSVKLYRDVPYPPTEIMEGLSRLIARKWENS